MRHHPVHTVSPPTVVPTALPPLHAGDRLARAACARRYAAHPAITRTARITGVGCVPAPGRLAQHSSPRPDRESV